MSLHPRRGCAKAERDALKHAGKGGGMSRDALAILFADDPGGMRLASAKPHEKRDWRKPQP
jgi:hypothetical protein